VIGMERFYREQRSDRKGNGEQKFHLPRNRKMPRVRSARPCVRARFEAVEMPLNRMKKSRNAWKKPLCVLLTIGKDLMRRSAPFQWIGSMKEPCGCMIPLAGLHLFPDERRFVFFLVHLGDGKDLSVHDDEDAGREQPRGKQALGEVLQTVAALKARGVMAPVKIIAP